MTDPCALSVFFVTRKWPPAVGGMETYSRRLSEELSKHVDVEIVALSGDGNGHPPSLFRLVLFPFSVIVRWLARPRVPDIIHLGDMAIWPLGLLHLASGGRTRVVLSAHGTDVSYHRRGGLKGRLYGAYLRLGARLLRRASVIANSRATRDVASETGWSATDVVPLATDMTGTAPTGAHNGRLLFAGRLIELKGCGWFVSEVLPLLPEDITLDVAGTVWNTNEGAALDHPRVRFLGPLDQAKLAEAYRSALCVIVPNIAVETGEYEGFGLVAPEAAAAGGVVIAARCDGLVDAVIESQTGLMVAPAAADEWVSAIREVSQWTTVVRKTFVERARRIAERQYSWDRVARDTLLAYRHDQQAPGEAHDGPRETGAMAPMLRRIAFAVGTIGFVLSLIYVSDFVVRNWPEQFAIETRFIVAAAVAYALCHVPTSLVWPTILREMHQPIPISRGVMIGLIAQAGKYLPGNVAQYLGRAALARNAGVTLAESGISTAIEILAAIWAAAIVGAGALVLMPSIPFAIVFGVAAAGVASVVLLAWAHKRRYGRMLLIKPSLLLVTSLLLGGASFSLVVGSWWAVPAFALAWLAGFLIPGAPAGLGVREAALVVMLEPVTNSGQLAAAIIIHRVITALVDALIASAAYLVFVCGRASKRTARTKAP